MTEVAHKRLLTIFRPADGVDDPKPLAQMHAAMANEHVVSGALMADHHLGYGVPIGAVIEYDSAIAPAAVGFDIACGNMAVRTGLTVTDVKDDLKGLARTIQKRIEFGIGRSNHEPLWDHALWIDPRWADVESLVPGLKERATQQLGTVGSGNHYVDLLADEDGRVWVANHFGSRGFGHTIASGFINLANGLPFDARGAETEDVNVLPTNGSWTSGSWGALYVELMELAGLYAYAGREFVTDQVLEVLGTDADFMVHNHHNYAWLEGGNWTVRKGATPLTEQPAYIGGSMGEGAAIVRGTGVDVGNLRSAPHGAGRVMSRTKAAGKLRKMWVCQTRDCDYAVRATPEGGGPVPMAIPEACPSCGNRKFKKMRIRDKSGAAVDWDATRAELSARGIVILGSGADEAPQVYKSLRSVLAAHENIQVDAWLEPLVVIMAPADVRDPYRD